MASKKPLGESVVKPIGIVTQPNKLGVFPPGALALATGVVMRSPALLENHGLWSIPASAPWASDTVKLNTVRPAKTSSYHLLTMYERTAAAGGLYYAWSETGPGSPFSYTPNPAGVVNSEVLSHFGSSSGTNRTILALRDSVACFDCDPAVSNPPPRIAGLFSPHMVFNGFLTGTNAGAMANKQHCHAIAVLRRVMFDGTELVSAPSPATHCFTEIVAGGPVNITYQVYATFGVQAGDYVDFYRTRAQSIDVSPAVSTNTGADFFKSVSYKIPSGFGGATVVDAVQEANLGEALYTNPGVRGEAAANYAPPVCRTVCSFKNYTFYLGVTDAPSITLRVGVAWGNFVQSASGGTPYARQFGIGLRYVLGNTVSGGTSITSAVAADLVGVKIGQRVIGGVAFTGALVVSSIVGTTVNFTGGTFNTTQSGTQSCQISDCIEIDGHSYLASSFDQLCRDIAVQLNTVVAPTLQVACQDLVLPLQGAFGTTFCPGTAPATDFTIFRPTSANHAEFGTMTIRATNGDNYSPPLPRIELGEPAQSIPAVYHGNFAQWSEENQPEAAPDANRFPIGNGDVIAAVETRDAMFVFSTDGLRRLSGTGGRAGDGFDWRVDPTDSTLLLAGDACVTVLQDSVYAYTTRGLVMIDSSGATTDLSRGRVGDAANIPAPLVYTPSVMTNWLVADKTNNEIVFYDASKFPSNPWVYNQLTDAFTQYQFSTGSSTLGPVGHAISTVEGKLLMLNFTAGCYVIAPNAASVLAQILYQPFYSVSPWLKRCWQRVHYVFENPSTPTTTIAIQALVNGKSAANLYPAASTLSIKQLDNGQDFARVSLLIPRNAPRIATQIQLGWKHLPNFEAAKFFGLTVDAEYVSTQRVQRG